MSEVEKTDRQHAVAIWQATFELNCFTTDAAKAWEDTVHDFESFWDDERPRIGESGGHGWCDPRSSSTGASGSEIRTINSSMFGQAWIEKERGRTARTFLPGRVADDNGDDDPYHVVLFGDIKSFLHSLTFSDLPAELVNAFLGFMHLPPLPDTQQPSYRRDQYLRNDLSDRVKLVSTASAVSTIEGNAPPRVALPYYRTTPDSLFEKDGNFAKSLTKHFTNDQITFMSNALEALGARYPDWTSFIEYRLAFELHTHPTTVRKTAKALLRSSPSNLRLYNAYALIESQLGKSDVAENVLRTAINMSSNLDAAAHAELPLLWHTLVWSTLQSNNHTLALDHLLRMTATGTLAPTPSSSTEHAEAYLNIARATTLTSTPTKPYSAAAASTLLTLLYCLTSSRDLPTALASFTAQSAILASYGFSAAPAIELLHQSQVALIDYHISHNLPYKPGLVRKALQESMAMVPGNTLVMELYARMEARFRLDDRVREVAKEVLDGGHSNLVKRSGKSARSHSVDESLPTVDDARLITTTWAIQNELGRAAKAGTGAVDYAVRAAFERAVADAQCKHSVSIWMKWVDWEMNLVPQAPSAEYVDVDDSAERHKGRKKTERLRKTRVDALKRVRDLWYRGLACLPWVKAWYLKGVEIMMALGDEGETEAKGVVEMMVDKGIRVFEEET